MPAPVLVVNTPLAFASRGAKILVNDLGGGVKGDTNNSSSAADKVVQEIKAKGGVAVANYDSVEFGEKIIKTAMDAFGRIDVIVNNAGILRDISFQKMKEIDWDLVIKVHLKGTFSVTRAAWNIFRAQNYGRIINTSSSSGLFGNFGQANYAAAKLGIHGLSQTLAKEGEKRNIFTNTIAPFAATRMTEGVLSPDILEILHPTNVVPMVLYLAHETCQENGSLFEVGGGFISKYRWNRTEGVLLDVPIAPEDIRDKWDKIVDFSKSDFPSGGNDTLPKILENAERNKHNLAKLKNQAAAQTQAKPQAAAPKGNHKCYQIFYLMNEFLVRGEGKSIIDKLQAVYNFDITEKKGGPVVTTFVIDLKNGQGKVYEGRESTADATFTMTDGDFEQVCLGTLNPQTAFIQVL